MKTSEVYSTKSEYYAKYRWDYAAEAIKTIIDTTRITSTSRVADIGAGTGMLTKHIAPLVEHIYAIEPNAAMRYQAERVLSPFPSCVIQDGSAEQTGLPTASIDLITAAQAVHWFDPEPTLREFERILHPSGWLAIIRNRSINDELALATNQLMTEEYGVKQAVSNMQSKTVPESFYFGNGSWQCLTFPFSFQLNWEQHLGCLLSASFTPDENDPHYEDFVTAARYVFERYSVNGLYSSSGETVLHIGQPS